MQRGNPNVWTVHQARTCHQVEKIVSSIELETIFSEKGRQPRAYFTGYGSVRVSNNIAYITKL